MSPGPEGAIARDEPWCAHCPLRELAWSDPFSPEDLMPLQARPGELRTAPADALLIREGEPESPVFVLATGWVSRSKLMPDGRELILQLHLPGDIIGYTPALLHGRPHFSVQALTTVTYYPLDRERVAGLFATAPALARKLLLRLSRRQRTVEYWLLNLGRRRVEERLAWFLLDLFARLRRLGLVRDNTFRLPLSQRQIADAIGAHVVHLNRVLRQFREAGLVSVRGREVRLDDPVRFRRVGCFCTAAHDTA